MDRPKISEVLWIRTVSVSERLREDSQMVSALIEVPASSAEERT